MFTEDCVLFAEHSSVHPQHKLICRHILITYNTSWHLQER